VPDHAAFLRGVNLGRNRRVSGAELGEVFEAMGFDDVATFRTSGNVVFDAGRKPGEARIERELQRALGYEVAIFLRTAAEVRAIAQQQPFAPDAIEASTGTLQVALLRSKPAAGVRGRALERATDEDRLAFAERELYWLPSGGIRNSALGMKGIEQLVGQTTIRTKGTLEKLAAKYFAD